MMHILYEPFPDSITADGREYKILTDFREWLGFIEMMADKSLSAEERAYLCGMWIEPEPAHITAGMVDGLIGFLRADALEPDPPEDDEDEPSEPEPPKPPVFSFQHDARFVLGDFRHYYGIDLLRIDYLHWWEFLSLLRALPDESTVMRRVSIRGTDLSQIRNKAQRAAVAKQQRAIALPCELDDEMIGALMWNL